jgi:hypothetical protein
MDVHSFHLMLFFQDTSVPALRIFFKDSIDDCLAGVNNSDFALVAVTGDYYHCCQLVLFLIIAAELGEVLACMEAYISFVTAVAKAAGMNFRQFVALVKNFPIEAKQNLMVFISGANQQTCSCCPDLAFFLAVLVCVH